HDRSGGDDVVVGGEVHGSILILFSFRAPSAKRKQDGNTIPELGARNKKPERDHPCGYHAPVVSHSGIGRIGLGTDPTGAARHPAAGVQESGPWSSCSAAWCRTRTSTAWTK